ncbi:MAG: hypothetical protein J0H94_02690 [Rhizobiales bacterium]|nr:hypothetical protein [Hyphomicrobiales bacterium]
MGARHPSSGSEGNPQGRDLVLPIRPRERGAETKERALKSPPRRPKSPGLADADLATARGLAALFDIPALCPEPACTRAHACAARGAPCIMRFRETYRDLVSELATWPVLFEEDEWWREP